MEKDRNRRARRRQAARKHATRRTHKCRSRKKGAPKQARGICYLGQNTPTRCVRRGRVRELERAIREGADIDGDRVSVLSSPLPARYCNP
jgi:hypothetical protein